MCLGIPAKILERNESAAVVELGGVRREISVMLIDDVVVGEWVMISFNLWSLSFQRESVARIESEISGREDEAIKMVFPASKIRSS